MGEGTRAFLFLPLQVNISENLQLADSILVFETSGEIKDRVLLLGSGGQLRSRQSIPLRSGHGGSLIDVNHNHNLLDFTAPSSLITTPCMMTYSPKGGSLLLLLLTPPTTKAEDIFIHYQIILLLLLLLPCLRRVPFFRNTNFIL